MSKLSKALVPQIGGHSLVPGVSTNGMPAGIQSDGVPTTAAVMGLQNTGLEGLAPGKWGIPAGAPDGLRQASEPDKNFLPHGVNAAYAPPPPPPPPGYNVWADPDITKRGWGWGMGSDGALHTGVVGGGPAGTMWGPNGGDTTTNTQPTMGPGSVSPGGQRVIAAMRAMGQQAPQMAAGGANATPPGQTSQLGPQALPQGYAGLINQLRANGANGQG